MVFKLQMNAYFYHFLKKEKENNGASFIRDFISLKNQFYFEGEKSHLIIELICSQWLWAVQRVRRM